MDLSSFIVFIYGGCNGFTLEKSYYELVSPKMIIIQTCDSY